MAKKRKKSRARKFTAIKIEAEPNETEDADLSSMATPEPLSLTAAGTETLKKHVEIDEQVKEEAKSVLQMLHKSVAMLPTKKKLPSHLSDRNDHLVRGFGIAKGAQTRTIQDDLIKQDASNLSEEDEVMEYTGKKHKQKWSKHYLRTMGRMLFYLVIYTNFFVALYDV